jgi:hypothetical protein
MASYIIVCSEVRSTIGGVKTCFPLSFSVSPGMNPISISSSVHLHRKILRNCKININGYELSNYKYPLNCNFVIKMTPLNFDTQIMKIYFNFFHISVDFKFQKGQTTSLVQKEPPQLQFNLPITPRALTFIQETSCIKLFVNT